MNFIMRLFSKDEPSENDILNYAICLINPVSIMENHDNELKLHKRYPNLSSEEIKNIVSKSSEILKSCTKIPASDNKFDERVNELYPYLSKKTRRKLRNAVYFLQEK